MPKTLIKILITGCSGFCGYWLIKHIRERFPSSILFGVDLTPNKNVNSILDNFYSLNLTDFKKTREIIDNIKPEIIFHLAGILDDENIEKIYEVNVGGTANLLEAVQLVKSKHKVKILLISSAAVYGNIDKKKNPIIEDYQICPTSHYGVSKAAVEMIGRLYSRNPSVEVVISRTFNLLGPGLSENLLPGRVTNEILTIKKGMKKNIIKVGNINSVRDFLDVRDVVKLYVNLALYGKSNEIYNVGSGKGIKISELIKLFIAESKLKISIISETEIYRNNDIDYSIADITKLSGIIAVKKEISTEQSISNMLEYVYSRPNKY